VRDNGSSFNQVNPMIGAGAQPTQATVLAVDSAGGFARIRFNSIRIEVAMPLGWQAQEDWERGVGFSADKRYRLIAWRLDFTFEGVSDAEHYAATKAGAIQARKAGARAQARKLADGSFWWHTRTCRAKAGRAPCSISCWPSRAIRRRACW
jgi:hypothetical protein